MSDKKSKALYNQLLIIENTEENRNQIKDLNKRMREYGSRWRLSHRYRKPKEGHKYGWGGSLKCENADGLGVYIKPCKEQKEAENKYSREMYEQRQREHRALNNRLEKYKEFFKKVSKELLPDGEWYAKECPLCKSNKIECYDDYVDSERWVCNNCDIDFSCNKEQKRFDLELDI